MHDYFRVVTLGAFTWTNKDRITLLFENIKKAGTAPLFLHFFLLTLCLNFPVVFQIVRLSPEELYSRLHGETFYAYLPQAAENILFPLLVMSFIVVMIIQIVFYLLAVFFLGLSRMDTSPLSFYEKMGLVLYSSTLPVLFAALFGLFILPAVHIIIYYFLVMFFMFQRSGRYAV